MCLNFNIKLHKADMQQEYYKSEVTENHAN